MSRLISEKNIYKLQEIYNQLFIQNQNLKTSKFEKKSRLRKLTGLWPSLFSSHLLANNSTLSNQMIKNEANCDPSPQHKHNKYTF